MTIDPELQRIVLEYIVYCAEQKLGLLGQTGIV